MILAGVVAGEPAFSRVIQLEILLVGLLAPIEIPVGDALQVSLELALLLRRERDAGHEEAEEKPQRVGGEDHGVLLDAADRQLHQHGAALVQGARSGQLLLPAGRRGGRGSVAGPHVSSLVGRKVLIVREGVRECEGVRGSEGVRE